MRGDGPVVPLSLFVHVLMYSIWTSVHVSIWNVGEYIYIVMSIEQLKPEIQTYRIIPGKRPHSRISTHPLFLA